MKSFVENLPFLVARRRNIQRRSGPGWVADLEARLGIRAGTIHLVPAEESVLRERKKEALLREGLVSGHVVRVAGCTRSDVVDRWDAFLSACSRDVMVCDLRHHPDYAFTSPPLCLVGKLAALLDFDGDTVGVSSEELSIGLVVDEYTRDEDTLFEEDRWGTR